MKKTTWGLLVFAIIGLLSVSLVSAFPFGRDMNEDMKDALDAAIEARDFESWKAIHEDFLTEEKFNEEIERHETMSQVHDLREQMREAREEGNFDRLEELREDFSEIMPERKMGFHSPQSSMKGDCACK